MQKKGGQDGQKGGISKSKGSDIDLDNFDYQDSYGLKGKGKGKTQAMKQESEEEEEESFEVQTYNIGGARSARGPEKKGLDMKSDTSQKKSGQAAAKGRYGIYQDDDDEDDLDDDDLVISEKKKKPEPLKPEPVKPLSKLEVPLMDHERKKSGDKFNLSSNKSQKSQKSYKSKVEEIEDKYESSIDGDNNFFNPLKKSQEAKKKEETMKKAAQVYAKTKKPINSDDDDDEEDEDEDDKKDKKAKIIEENLDNLNEPKKKKRRSVKGEHFFNYQDDAEDREETPHIPEEGLPVGELEVLNNYFAGRTHKQTKKRRRIAKSIRLKNHFYTSRCYMLYHLVQNIIYWMVVIIFPLISVIGCYGGHSWMSHVAIGLFLGLSLVFDFVFAASYSEREGLKYDLKAFKNGMVVREGKCKHMLLVYIEIIFELCMTYIGLLDIYCDVAFATIAQKEGLTAVWGASVTSLVFIIIPKIYALVLVLMMMFNCVREEDRRRKYAYRALIFNEYRLQALNVEYIAYERHKVDLLMGFFKFIFEDVMQFGAKVWYLTQTDCGKKNINTIVYLGVMIAVLNTYFGLLYRLITYCYSLKRLNAFKRKLEVRVSNLQLQSYGHRHIRDKIHDNKAVEAVSFTGENYEYMVINEGSVKKFTKILDQFPLKEKIDFLDINKIRIESVRQAKAMLLAIDRSLSKLKYLAIQQSSLCQNFILQLKTYLDGNDSLVRISFVLNQMVEEDCYDIIETCLEHPNLEILQMAERIISVDDNGNDTKEKSKLSEQSLNKISICKGIQVRLQQNEAMKKLEMRFIHLSRQCIQAIFKGLAKNNTLQKLILSHDALKNATVTEYQLLGEALKSNKTLLYLDLSQNTNFDDNMNFHSEVTDCLINSPDSKLQKIFITTISIDVKAHYLELIDQKPNIFVYVNDKILEDVDIQE